MPDYLDKRCNCENENCTADSNHEPGGCRNAAVAGTVIFLGHVCDECWLGYPSNCRETPPLEREYTERRHFHSE